MQTEDRIIKLIQMAVKITGDTIIWTIKNNRASRANSQWEVGEVMVKNSLSMIDDHSLARLSLALENELERRGCQTKRMRPLINETTAMGAYPPKKAPRSWVSQAMEKYDIGPETVILIWALGLKQHPTVKSMPSSPFWTAEGDLTVGGLDAWRHIEKLQHEYWRQVDPMSQEVRLKHPGGDT